MTPALEHIKALCSDFRPVGSRVTCDPAPTDTDQDYLLLVAPLHLGGLQVLLAQQNWEELGSMVHDRGQLKDGSEFKSWRLGEDNLIVTWDYQFFHKFWAATTVAKYLNVLDKAQRVALFQAVLYGEDYRPKRSIEVSLSDWANV